MKELKLKIEAETDKGSYEIYLELTEGESLDKFIDRVKRNIIEPPIEFQTIFNQASASDTHKPTPRQ